MDCKYAYKIYNLYFHLILLQQLNKGGCDRQDL
jgi:hypothetical protein